MGFSNRNRNKAIILFTFTQDEISGAITYCTSENIAGLPYPLEVPPGLNGVCQIIALPNFEPYGEYQASQFEYETVQVKITYDAAVAMHIAQSQLDALELSSENRVGFWLPFLWMEFLILMYLLAF